MWVKCQCITGQTRLSVQEFSCKIKMSSYNITSKRVIVYIIVKMGK
jgi:hypothetical protein